MRIALVVPGGVDRSGERRVIPALLWLVERLARRHDVHVLVPAQEPRPGTWPLFGATVHNVGRPLETRWGFGRGRRASLGALLALHRRAPFDLFHAFWARGPGEVAVAAARRTGRPVLVHVAGGELVWLPEVAFGTRGAWRRALIRRVVRRADRVSVASGAMADLVERAGARTLPIPLGVDLRTWVPESPRPRCAVRPARLVHVGSLTPVKDHATLLDALARLTGAGHAAHLDLVGEDTSDGAVQRHARALGLEDRITVHGFLPQERAAAVVRAADLMVVSSRHEAGPVALLEAAAVGVPTVGTAVGHVRDLAPDAAVAVPVGDPDALAAAIAGLLDDDVRRLALAGRAQEAALRQDADWTAARFEGLYREVTGQAVGADAETDAARAVEADAAGASNARVVDPDAAGPDAARIAERLATWRRTGDLGALWPDVSAEARAAAHAEVRRVTAAVLQTVQPPPTRPASGPRVTLYLPDAARDAGPTVPSARLDAAEPERVRALGVAAFLTGMGPLLGRWAEDGRIEASGAVDTLLAEHLEQGRRRAERLGATAARVAAALEEAGMPAILLKGMHTGARYFPEPGTRPAADIDLLIPHEKTARAADVLVSEGLIERRRTRWAARSEWTPAEGAGRVRSLRLEHAEDPWSIDLHTRLERWYFRGLRAGLGDVPFGEAPRVPIAGGRPVRVLPEPHLAAFLALHTSYDPGRLRLVGLVELVLVLRADTAAGVLDWGALADLLRRTGSARFVQPALTLAESLSPGTVDPALLTDLERRATRRTRTVVDALLAADLAPLPRPSLESKLVWARGPRQLLLGLSELVLPSDDGETMGLVRLQTRRLRALASGRAGWRARGGAGRLRT